METVSELREYGIRREARLAHVSQERAAVEQLLRLREVESVYAPLDKELHSRLAQLNEDEVALLEETTHLRQKIGHLEGGVSYHAHPLSAHARSERATVAHKGLVDHFAAPEEPRSLSPRGESSTPRKHVHCGCGAACTCAGGCTAEQARRADPVPQSLVDLGSFGEREQTPRGRESPPRHHFPPGAENSSLIHRKSLEDHFAFGVNPNFVEDHGIREPEHAGPFGVRDSAGVTWTEKAHDAQVVGHHKIALDMDAQPEFRHRNMKILDDHFAGPSMVMD
jgi:hypothetical protein